MPLKVKIIRNVHMAIKIMLNDLTFRLVDFTFYKQKKNQLHDITVFTPSLTNFTLNV